MADELHIKKSRYLAYILRHNPLSIALELDEHGWADVEQLLTKMRQCGKSITLTELKEIVQTDEKERYSFSDDEKKIRANYGHSVQVDLELKPTVPPDILYHGTCKERVDSIKKAGLNKGSRLYVHLTSSEFSATKLSELNENPYVFKIDAKAMYNDGYKIFHSKRTVWLTEYVPPKYLIQ